MKKFIQIKRISVGATLLELLIGLAIVAILLTAVGPNVQSILISNRITADVNGLSSLMRFAKHTAVNEQRVVTVCSTSNFTSCSGNWNNGKMVFIDGNGNGQRDADEALLASGDPTSKNNTLSGTNQAFSFAPDGSADEALTLTYCPSTGEAKYARALLVTLYGKISISVDSNGDGIAENASGSALSC
ncbi:pilus assembly protein [Alteromonas sediminis]|uniref:Type II secretion system protein H n=2 Tax=Alteromonas sediminis TaxID=2259342 RepID=A0A3N5Z6B9_9ALTE|nr:pilus assembly protein [Alteromonas sediminis]